MVAILVLNWNGFEDTIQCLKSLLASDNQDFFIILGDNGSTNGSLEHIECFLKSSSVEYCRVGYGDGNLLQTPSKVMLYDLKMNNGFSRGNNLMLEVAFQYSPNYYLFLNNDTEVKPDFLDQLISFQKNHKSYKILTPLIYYYSYKDKIWNAGGKIKFGFRKYFYGDTVAAKFKENDFIECSFVTGCALFVTPDVLYKNNKIFTERFFFGEEDFEFSMRQIREGNKMACVLDSIIYHKVSASSAKHININKDFIYYLNRFVNIKMTFPKLKYYLWKLIYIPYIFILLLNKYSFSQCKNFLVRLLQESLKLESVDKSYFEKVMRTKDLF